jgi:hypothetical protein
MTAAMPLARPDDQAVSPFAGADVCRLAGLRLLPGRRGPAFGDDVWDFTAVAGLPAQMQLSYRRWDFTAITAPAWRLVAKEQLMALLAPRHEAVAVLARASRTPMHLRTCQLRFAELVRLLNWLPAQGAASLGQLTSEHCQAYLVHRREIRGTDGRLAGQHGPSTVLRAACAVTGLVSYRELFTADRPPAGLRPFGGASAARAAQLTQPAGNKTRPVPDDVLQPMLSAALYVTGTLGPRLTGLARQVRAAGAHRAGLPGPASKTTPATQLAAVVQSHLDRGVPLPRLPGRFLGRRLTLGWESGDPLLTVNLDAIAREAGAAYFPAGWLPAMRGQLEHAVRAVGAEASFGRDAAHVQHPSGSVPWTLPLDLHDSRDLIGMARTACLIVIAAISGMRASELMELTASSPVPPQQLQPGLERYRLASLLVKGQPLGGTADEWVVIQPVHQAAELAAALLGEDIPKTSPLFGRFSFQPRYQAFRSWVNGPAGHRLGLAPIPDGTVTPQALRRTLALQLAHRPGGLLAAKIHLKHVIVATTEGYAARPGGAQARLLAEINTEETERNLGLALTEFRNYQRGVMPAGPGARELTALFARIDTAVTTPAPGDAKIHNSDRDILNLLSKQAATLHLGIANYCWFTDPSRALCLQLAGTPAASQPLAGMCDSARCPQATHHPRHRDVWASHAAATKTFLGTLGRTRTTEHTRLQADHDRAIRVIAAIDAAASPATENPEH